MRALSGLLIWLGVLSCHQVAWGDTSAAEQALERMKSVYATRLSEYAEATTTKQRELQAHYARSLDELVLQVQGQGMLDALIYLRAHRDSYLKTKSVPDTPDPAAPPALIRLQQGYWTSLRDMQRENATRTTEMVRAYLTRLDQLKRELTVQGKLEEAMLFLREFNAVSATPEGVTAMKPPATREVSAPPTPVVGRLPHWPSTSQGLHFFWVDGRHPFNGADARGVLNKKYTLSKTGDCTISDRLIFQEGRVVVEDAGPDFTLACRESNSFSLVASIKPTRRSQQGPARMISLSSGWGMRNFTLGQSGDNLIFRLRTSQSSAPNGTEIQLMPMVADRVYRIVLRYEPGNLRMHVDGVSVEVPSINGTLEPWEASHRLVLGNEWKDERPWRGELRNVALFSRFLDNAEAQRLSLP